MMITWWELEELLEHFKDIGGPRFEQLSDNMWLKLHMPSESREFVPWYGIAIAIPSERSRYTCATVRTSLIDTSAPEIDLEWMFAKFTSYNIRLRIQEALVEELKCDQRTAQLMAVGLTYIALVSAEPSMEEPPMSAYDADRQPSTVMRLVQGGWVKLTRTTPSSARIEIGIRMAQKGHLCSLRGTAYTHNGHPGALSAFLPILEAEPDEEFEPDPYLPEVTHEPSNLRSDTVLSEVQSTFVTARVCGTGSDSGSTDSVSSTVRDGETDRVEDHP